MTLNLISFEKIIEKLDLNFSNQVAVAVSGGADSLCLTLLLNQYCQNKQIKLTALTVNHNIRKESLEEAKFVHSFLKNKGVNHIILENNIPIGKTAVEEEAREIRYKLLTSYCREKNISYLFIAHQLEDQAETFLSRLARGSGIDGLSAMSGISKRDGVFLVRPFLSVSKKEIQSFLKKNKIEWVLDPMNENPIYERVRWRKFLPLLENNGIKIKSIFLSTVRMSRAQEALKWMVNSLSLECVKYFDEGYALIQKDLFLSYPDEIKIRILMSVLKNVGQSDKIISLELLERAISLFPQKMTLANCVLIPHKKGIFVAKEYAKIQKKTKIKAHTLTRWDRFEIVSSMDGYIFANEPLNRKKNIPYLVQKSFPFFSIEKELENEQEIGYKNNSNSNIKIKFIYNR